MKDDPITKRDVDRQTVDENAPIVHSIILWRIYDVLLLLLRETNPEVAGKVAEMHEQGLFVGPNPAYKEVENAGEHSGE